jgi:hypothetical protein
MLPSAILARIVVLSKTAAFDVRAADRPSHKWKVQGRLSAVVGEKNSLKNRSEGCIVGIGAVYQSRTRIHLGNVSLIVLL